MVIDFSKIDLHKRPNLILKNFDEKAISTLGHVLKPKAEIYYNEISKISFEYPAYVNGERLHEYDLLTGMRIIDLQGFGQFKLHNPEEVDNGIRKIKKCTGYSLEYDFADKSISIEEGTYNFWNPLSPDNAILGIILSEMPSWKIGFVSKDLIGKYRTFSINGRSIYDFMKSDLEKTYECVFDFDTYKRMINVYATSDPILTKPIYISTNNLAKKIEIKESTDDLFTVLEVNGADGIDIRSVNPMGENKIYNLDLYMTEEYFSKDMIHKWNNWKSAFETNQTLYYSIVIAQNMKISQYAVENAVLADLQGELKSLESQKAVLIQTVSMDSSLQKRLDGINSQIEFKKIEISDQKGILEEIQVKIENYISQLKSINKETSFSSFFTEDELILLDRYFKCGSLTDSSFVAADIGSYSSELTVVRNLSSVFYLSDYSKFQKVDYTDDMTFYTIRGGNIKASGLDYELLAEISNCTLQVNSDDSFIMSAYLNKGKINKEEFPSGTISLTGTLSGKVLYSDNNTQFSTISAASYLTYEISEYQRMSVAWDLFEYGKNTLDKKSLPTYHCDIDVSNFLALDDFISFTKSFELGKRIYLHLGLGIIEPVVIGVQIDFEDLTKLKLELTSDFQVKNGKFSWLDNLNQSISVSKTLDFNQYNYSNFVNSGAKTNVKKFMESSIDTMKNMIMSGDHNEITIDQTGLRCRKYDEISGDYSPKQIWLSHNSLMFTNDNWGSAAIGIGEFVDKNLGSLYGIVVPALMGTILAGNNLIIESQKTDGGVAVFKVDGEGASLHNASFNLYGNTGGRIDLGAVFGIVGGGDKNKLFTYNSQGQATGVQTTKSQSVIRIADLDYDDTPNANFWIDMYGDVYLKGTIDAVGGVFRGSLEVGGPSAFRVDSQGNLKIGGTENNPNFSVDATGNMKAKNGEFKGRVDASSLYVNGRNILTNTSGNNLATDSSKIDSDYLDLYGITIRNKQTNGITFQVAENGAVTINGNITMGAGSSINWASVNEINFSSSQAYQRANDAINNAASAYDRADSAYTQASSAATKADNAYSLADTAYDTAWANRCTSLNVFNALTNGGTRFGIFSSESGQLVINANYIRSGTIDADVVTLGTSAGGFCCATGNDGKKTTNGAKMFGAAGKYGSYYFHVTNAGAMIHAGNSQFYVVNGGIHASEEISVDSDKRFKTKILNDLNKYEKFFYSLKPATFQLKSQKNQRRHIGFIAQELDVARNECGLSKNELALLETFQREDSDGELKEYYGIRYGEIIPMCVYMIQKLHQEICELKSKMKEE